MLEAVVGTPEGGVAVAAPAPAVPRVVSVLAHGPVQLVGQAGMSLAMAVMFTAMFSAASVVAPHRSDSQNTHSAAMTVNSPDVTTAIDLVPNVAQKREVNVALSNSFGFGGTNAALIVSKV